MAKDLVARNLVVKLTADYETFIKKNKEGASSFDAMVYSIEKNKKQLREVGTIMTTVGATLTASLGLMAKSAADEEQVFRDLQTQVELTGNSWADSKPKIDAWIASLQATTKYGDTDTAQVLKKLLVFTKDLDAAMAASKLSMDMAASGLFDVDTASRMVGMAMSGNVQMLGRYIPELKTSGNEALKNATASERAAYAMEVLQQKFGGAAEKEILSFNGAMAQANNYVGDIFETIGASLLPVMTDVAHKLRDVSKQVIGFINEHQKLTTILTVAAGAVGMLATGLGSVLYVLPNLVSGFKTLMTAFQAAQVFMTGPWGLAIAGVVAGIALVVKYWDELSAGMQTLWLEVIKPVVEGMKTAFASIWTVAEQVWGFIWDKVQSVLKGMWDIFSPVVDFYISGISQIWEIYEKIFGLIWDKVKTVIGAMYDSFRWLLDKLGVELPEIDELFKGIGDTAGNVADAVTNKWESMKETYRRQMDAVKSKSDEINDAIKTKTVETVDAVVEEHERAATAIQGKNTETKDFIINDTMPALRKVHTETVEAVEVEWKDYEQDVAGENGTMARVRDGITSQFDAARNTINGALKSIGETFTEDILKGNFSTAIKHLKDSFDETIKKIRDNFVNSLAQGLMGWVEGGFKDILGSISGSVSKVIGGLGSGAASTATSGTAAAGAGGLFSNLGGAAMTAGIGLAVSGVIAGLTALFNRTPPSEKRRRDDANDALPAVAREVEEAVNAGKMSEEEAAFRLKMVEDAAAAGEILNYLLVQPTSKARLDYWKGEDMSKHSATRARALWQWADEKWAEMGNTVGAPLSTVTFHQGGVIEGVLGQEKLIRALVGEEVLTRDDPRHRDNLGGGVVVNVTGNYINSELDLERLFRRFSERLMREMNIRGRVYA